MSKQPEKLQEKIVIDTGIFPRELLEKACREIKANQAKRDEANKVS